MASRQRSTQPRACFLSVYHRVIIKRQDPELWSSGVFIKTDLLLYHCLLCEGDTMTMRGNVGRCSVRTTLTMTRHHQHSNVPCIAYSGNHWYQV